MLPSYAERQALEELADHIETVARTRIGSETSTPDRGSVRKVREQLYMSAWDIKQIARYGTPSYRI